MSDYQQAVLISSIRGWNTWEIANQIDQAFQWGNQDHVEKRDLGDPGK